jgi:hypothetical protein
MAYDSVIDKPQGSVKLAEIFTDRAIDVIETAIGETGLIIVEQLRNVMADAIRKNSYILHSDGRVLWDGSNINFVSDSENTNIILTLLQTENAALRRINLVLTGGGSNTANTFNNIALNDKEMIYIELDRNTILNGSGDVVLENAAGGGSLISGYTVKKVSVNLSSSGMPSLQSPITGGNTDTFNIPLAVRYDYLIGAITYQDLWWIPHGIRWPQNTRSVIGAVVVQGFDVYPNVFVSSTAELVQALIDYSDGGVICVKESFVLDQSVTLPTGVTLIGRSMQRASGSPAIISLDVTGGITMQSHTRIKDIAFYGNSNFGQTGNHTVITMSNSYCYVENCSFEFQNTGPTNTATAILCSGSYNKIEKCKFVDVVSPAYKIGVNYIGSYNADIDCEFT